MAEKRLSGWNERRADWAQAAVTTFMKQTGLKKEDGIQTAIMDLLADLNHLADRYGLDFAELAQNAALHYNAETSRLCKKCKVRYSPEDDSLEKALCAECGRTK